MSLNKHLYEGIHFTLQNISAQGSLLTNWQIKRKILTTEYSQIIKYFFNYKANILSWLIRVHLRWIKVKIILYRFISVVWLTNFLSEIRNLINPRWWLEQQFLSVKRCQSSSWRTGALMIAHFPLSGKWKELVLSEWFL